MQIAVMPAPAVAVVVVIFSSLIDGIFSIAVDSSMKAAVPATWRSRLDMAVEELDTTVADLEISHQGGLLSHLNTTRHISSTSVAGSVASRHGGSGGPATLGEYCAGEATEQERHMQMKPGQKVQANWGKYGTYYPGKIKEKNDDGSIDVDYDDGFEEDNMSPNLVKPVQEDEDEESEEGGAKQATQRNDAACKIVEILEKIKQALKDLEPKVAAWLAAQRAKIAKNVSPQQVNPAVAAPAAAPPGAPSASDSEELEELKAELANLDARIAELKKLKQENAEALHKAIPTSAPSTGVQTVNDLIAQYKAKIVERNSEIQSLLKDIEAQEQELARIGALQVSLDAILAVMSDLEKDAEEAKRKRDELERNGELDPDLRMLLDKIIEELKKMRERVDNLMAIEAKNKARKAEAKKKAELALQAAKEKGDKAAEEEAKRAKDEAEEAAKAADLETLKAAQDVKKDLDEAAKGADDLDTGLHPHGAKWWRYRYEHSFIEAVLMIFVSVLMLFWSRMMKMLRHYVKVWGLPRGATMLSHIEEIDQEVHGTFYSVWLTSFAQQMMVCILVYFTVWILAKTGLLSIFTIVLKPTPHFHVPLTAEEYRELALDITSIYFFAIFLYFCLMFPVAHDTREFTSSLEEMSQGSEFERLQSEESPRDPSIGLLSSSIRVKAAKALMGTALRRGSTMQLAHNTFDVYMDEEMPKRQEPDAKEICRLLGDDMGAFPMYKYLILDVRITTLTILECSWSMWLPVVVAFLCFTLLHRFAHIGYVRIMFGFIAFTLVIIGGMAWYTTRVSKILKEATGISPRVGPKTSLSANSSDKEQEPDKPPFTIAASTVLSLFQFALFFLCYGVARMTCQTWMWTMHFWTVFGLTCFALVQAMLFIIIVSPAIPSFCAVMSLPPNIDTDKLEVMLHVCKSITLTSRGC